MEPIDELAERAARDLRADVRSVTNVEAGLAAIQGASPSRPIQHGRRSRWIIASSMAAAAAVLVVVLIARDEPRRQIAPADVPTTQASTTQATTPVETVPVTTQVVTAATCDPSELLVAVAAAVPASWTAVTVDSCHDGFARLVAIADQSSCPAGTECRKNMPFWMQDVGGQWTYLTSGTEIGCAPDQISPEIEEACAFFATQTTVPTTSTIAEATSIDGPVIRYPLPSTDEVGMAAEIRGVLQLEGACLYVSTADGVRYPVLWPAGTTWDELNQYVVLPGLVAIPMGNVVLGGRGFLNVSNVERLADSVAADRARECVDNTYDEIAVFNNQPDAVNEVI